MKTLALLLLIAGVSRALAQTPSLYPDGHGGKVMFPLGDISFADEVVSFRKGSPAAGESYSNPSGAIGVPNYDQSVASTTTTLGCGGELVVRFSDNSLVDVEGPDLFEQGPAVEPMAVAVSIARSRSLA